MKTVATFTLSNFLKFNKGKNCRAKCGQCNKEWSQTGTEQVHQAEKVISEKSKFVPVISYICDNCKGKLIQTEQ